MGFYSSRGHSLLLVRKGPFAWRTLSHDKHLGTRAEMISPKAFQLRLAVCDVVVRRLPCQPQRVLSLSVQIPEGMNTSIKNVFK